MPGQTESNRQNNNKKNVAIFMSRLRGGGAGRMAANLSCLLSEQYNVFLFIIDAKNTTYDYEGQLIDMNLPSAELLFFQKLFTFFKRIKNVNELKKRFNIDVTISFLACPNLINLLSNKQGKKIISVRTLQSYYRKESFLYGVKPLYRKADSIVAISEVVKSDLVKRFNLPEKKIKTIYNSCNSIYIKEKSNERIDPFFENLFKNYKIIINIGRLSEDKAQDHLLRAFKKVYEKDNRCRLLIFGEGDRESSLIELVKELGLSTLVIFMGYVANVFKYLSKAEIFILSSRVEGLGNAILEAMACGIPVISTDCKAGPREIIAPESSFEKQIEMIEIARNGILIPSSPIIIDQSDSQANEILMADSILKILNDQDLKNRLVQNAARRINDFSPDKIKKQWIHHIENICATSI